MRLSSIQLRRIAVQLETLAKMSGTVKEFEMDGFVCVVEKYNAMDQRDSDQYFLTEVRLK